MDQEKQNGNPAPPALLPNPSVAQHLLAQYGSSGQLPALAANLFWIVRHERSGLPNTPAQQQRRMDAFMALPAEEQQGWLDLATGFAAVVCFGLSMRLKIEEGSPLWTPDKARQGQA